MWKRKIMKNNVQAQQKLEETFCLFIPNFMLHFIIFFFENTSFLGRAIYKKFKVFTEETASRMSGRT